MAISNEANATFINNGTVDNKAAIFNKSGGTIENSGTINNSNSISLLSNHGIMTNYLGGIINNSNYFNNHTGGTLTNFGTINNSNNFNNFGLLNNAGTINSSQAFNNVGTYRGNGLFKLTNGSTFTNTGLVTPTSATFDNTSLGTMTIDGNYIEQGTVLINLLDSTHLSLLSVLGQLTLDVNSTLTVNLLSGFTPFSGEMFNVVKYGSLAGTYANTPASFLLNGFNWNWLVSYGTTTPGYITLTLEQQQAMQAPEPSTYIVLLSLLCVAFWVSRAKKMKRT